MWLGGADDSGGLKGFAASNRVWLLAHPTSLAIVAVAGLGGAAVGVPIGDDAFTYLWADGEGNGEKAVIAFNKNEVIYLIEVSP